MQFFLEHHFHPDHCPPTTTTTQINLWRKEAGHATPVHEPECGERRGEYNMNHKNIVNVFDQPVNAWQS